MPDGIGTYNITDGGFKRDIEPPAKKKKKPTAKSVKSALKKASK